MNKNKNKKEQKNLKSRLGKTQQKILILLLGGFALGLSGNPKKYFKILGEINESLKEVDNQALRRSIKSLYESKLIDQMKNKDGTITLILSEEGTKKALTFDLKNIKIKKPKKWDGKWRIVLFDVPEKKKNIRDNIRFHLKNIGLYEYQKSVFIFPYDCKDEIEYIMELNDAREFIRFILAEHIDNELHIKNIFDLE